jgi:hypothetical protein
LPAAFPPAVNTTRFMPSGASAASARPNNSSRIQMAAGWTATRYFAGFPRRLTSPFIDRETRSAPRPVYASRRQAGTPIAHCGEPSSPPSVPVAGMSFTISRPGRGIIKSMGEAAPVGLNPDQLIVRFLRGQRGVAEFPARPDPAVIVHAGKSVHVACDRAGRRHRGVSVHGDVDIYRRAYPPDGKSARKTPLWLWWSPRVCFEV